MTANLRKKEKEKKIYLPEEKVAAQGKKEVVTKEGRKVREERTGGGRLTVSGSRSHLRAARNAKRCYNPFLSV